LNTDATVKLGASTAGERTIPPAPLPAPPPPLEDGTMAAVVALFLILQKIGQSKLLGLALLGVVLALGARFVLNKSVETLEVVQ